MRDVTLTLLKTQEVDTGLLPHGEPRLELTFSGYGLNTVDEDTFGYVVITWEGSEDELRDLANNPEKLYNYVVRQPWASELAHELRFRKGCHGAMPYTANYSLSVTHGWSHDWQYLVKTFGIPEKEEEE